MPRKMLQIDWIGSFKMKFTFDKCATAIEYLCKSLTLNAHSKMTISWSVSKSFTIFIGPKKKLNKNTFAQLWKRKGQSVLKTVFSEWLGKKESSLKCGLISSRLSNVVKNVSNLPSKTNAWNARIFSPNMILQNDEVDIESKKDQKMSKGEMIPTWRASKSTANNVCFLCKWMTLNAHGRLLFSFFWKSLNKRESVRNNVLSRWPTVVFILKHNLKIIWSVLNESNVHY